MEQLILGLNNKVINESENDQLVFDKKLKASIDRLKAFEPKDGYYLAFSGGKDSVVIYELAKMAGVKFDAHYAITTVDPPELTKFIKNNYKDVDMIKPKINMWDLIVKKKMPPTRVVRYCCDVLKEEGGNGRTVITGVRWAESARRKNNRQEVEYNAYGSQAKKAKQERSKFSLLNDNDEKRKMIESCTYKGKHIVNPIIEWTDEEVWKFIKDYNVPYCKLYDEGYTRLGCLGCPLQGKKIIYDFINFPYVFYQYKNAFDRMNENRINEGMPTEWKDGHDVMMWWIGIDINEYNDLINKILQSSRDKDNKQIQYKISYMAKEIRERLNV
jgi:phosphoadenosine phosphosulfate reductase